MPYRRRYNRRYRRTSNNWDKASKALSVATSALATAKLVKSLVNVEFKETVRATNLSPDASGTVVSLNAIGQGDDKDDRNGNSIKNKSLLVRMRAEQNSSATNTSLRVLFIRDKQVNGSTPLVTDVLQAANPLSSLNTDYGKRFVVLADSLFSLSSNGTTCSHRKIFKKLGFHTEFGGTGNSVADINSGAIWMLAVSDEATNTPTLFYNTKVRYLDN